MRQVRELWWGVRVRTGAGLAWMFPGFSAPDLHLWIGVALLSVGAEQVYHPLAWLTPGALFTYLAWPKRPMLPVKPRKDS